MTEPVDVVRLRDGRRYLHAVGCDGGGGCECAARWPLEPWQAALLRHLQMLTDAVEAVEDKVGALHDRLDTLERAWKARGAL